MTDRYKVDGDAVLDTASGHAADFAYKEDAERACDTLNGKTPDPLEAMYGSKLRNRLVWRKIGG